MSAKHDTSAASEKESLGLGALARRRALLSGLGKGGAVLAAASPIKSMAGGSFVLTCQSQKTDHTVIATVSGSQSAAHSFVAGGGVTQVPACGKKASTWCGSGTSWPTGCSKTTTTFKGCFGSNPPGTPSGSTPLLMDCLKGTYGADCAHWSAAYLNGCGYYQSGQGKFPYPHITGSNLKGVKDWYTDADAAKALAFFTSLENDGV